MHSPNPIDHHTPHLTGPAQPIAIMGGSFNPIHYGHLRPALELQQRLGFAAVHLMPNHIAPHKAHDSTTTEQRCAMLELAIQGAPTLVLDTCELTLPQPNYSVATLSELRQRYPDTPLCFIIGMDSFINLPKWYRWESLLDYCHLIVCQRPGWQPTYCQPLRNQVLPHQITEPSLLHQDLHGHLYFTQVTQLAISSSQIRQLRQQGQSIKYLLPDPVIDYIEQNQLYL
ncbi:nicotinate-nucleotide adenylyltransferase [Motilimonas eburnea]|uniref:nicotinate-nucleotide adenylyltransferase n=1 Tax=Motilimonas eburnea TaxID=1737488 RepID=UPI001E357B10|nr:nicotinate-nucleotide adenylyltransferase [Motilimonas eburnea]MCE2569961.1 nicotinate-nucleotide adenylyltransferase [Motilimonas eburnea]